MVQVSMPPTCGKPAPRAAVKLAWVKSQATASAMEASEAEAEKAVSAAVVRRRARVLVEPLPVPRSRGVRAFEEEGARSV
jgi:hypothetical protein